MKPWWFCCGRRSYLCVLDTIAHRLHVRVPGLCDAHDRAILGENVTFTDATDLIDAALADPEVAARVREVRREMAAMDDTVRKGSA